ncbi:MAG: threonine synthase [Pyrinomonadaceae bacterium]
MHYFSTNRKSPLVTFAEAVMEGQPDDKGLYFPSEMPMLPGEFFEGMPNRSNEEIAFDVIRPYVDGEIPDPTLFEICNETVNFRFPLVPITERISALELFHGPTLAFKDVGARFMSLCLQYFSRHSSKKIVVIVATSGDTGGAVGAGFHGLADVEVVILYPKGKVSRVQELQLTTLGENVTTLELHGTFDDCQAIAKRALADPDLRSKASITSANSINVARWLPQQFYYFFAVKQWQGAPPVVSVPSGNFGNLASGVLAKTSGLPIDKFIAATNANDVVPRFFDGGKYDPRPSVTTLSNAMDVGGPSNFVRILEIFDNDISRLKVFLSAVSISDARTSATMKEVYEKYGYILEPHGAVSYAALSDALDQNPERRGFMIETAHPIKFDSVLEILGTQGDVPPAVQSLFSKPKLSIVMPNDYGQVKDLLISKL